VVAWSSAVVYGVRRAARFVNNISTLRSVDMKAIGSACRAAVIAATFVALCSMAICSQQAAAAVTTASGGIVVWDGTGAGWTNPSTSTIQPESTNVHGSKTALQFTFNDNGRWLGAGWNWLGFKKGAYGADISRMRVMTLWVKSTGSVTDLQINLLCNGKVADTPAHHTDKVHLSTYCPMINDGLWHNVSIPLASLKQPQGFDAKHVCEIQLGFMADHPVAGSYIFDGIAFRP
jgi:rhodanese-related sulfurtransferase